MSELTNNQNPETLVEQPVERVDFNQAEVKHSEPAVPVLPVNGAQRQGVLSEEHLRHIRSVDGYDVEAEALKVLPKETVKEVVIGKEDADRSASWLAVLKQRVAKLKGNR